MTARLTNAAELDALPVGSIVVEGDHTTPDAFWGLAHVATIPGVFHRFPDGWYVVAGYGAREVPLPATVLYRPDAPAVDRDQLAAALRYVDCVEDDANQRILRQPSLRESRLIADAVIARIEGRA